MNSNRSRIVGPVGIVISVALGADAPPPKGYVCVRAKEAVTIDGGLGDPAWADAPWTEEFVDIEGEVKPRPRFRTRVKMLWDDSYFYIAAELVEPHVWGTLTEHDSVIFHDNDFEVFIDPDGDNHEYYELEINALNTEWDLLLEKPYRDGGPAVNAWEIPGLKTATRTGGRINDFKDEDTGWTVEIAIPWSALAGRANRPCPPRQDDQWRVNFSRVEWEHQIVAGAYRKVPNRREDNWVWSPQGAIDMHRPERWGFVQFSTSPPGQDAYRVDPSGPIRDRLMAIYHAQRAYRQKSQAWARTLGDLELGELPVIPGAGDPILKMTPDGFEASITRQGTTWNVRQDSRLRQLE